MYVISVRNVREALPAGIKYLLEFGREEESRAGLVLVAPTPVTTVYERPRERVLLSPIRDANPFFHLFEALWMLSGHNDARWLDQFVHDFSSRFAEKDGRMHGAYGYRWLRHFDLEGGGHPLLPDQLTTVVDILTKDPTSRQAVISMWDPAADLGAMVKDKPCNTHIYLRIQPETRVLDMTVCCRSNDIIWGAYGANAVHFSILQEYLAGRIGVNVGKMYQISNNYHSYTNVLERMASTMNELVPQYEGEISVPLANKGWGFDHDLCVFMELFCNDPFGTERLYINNFFSLVVEPMFLAHKAWRKGQKQEAIKLLQKMPTNCDWRNAAELWFVKRMSKIKESVDG